MKQSLKKVLVMGLSLLLALTACQKSGQPFGSEAQTDPVAMGRYMEEELELPQGIGYVQSFRQLENGKLRLIGNRTADNMIGPWDVWESADYGKTWNTVELPWISQLDNAVVVAADFTSGGDLYLQAITNARAVMEQELARADEKAESQPVEPVYSFLHGDAASLTEMGYEPTFTEEGIQPRQLRLASNGDLLVDDHFSIHQASLADGKLKYTYDGLEDREYKGDFLTYGNTLAISLHNQLKLYDLSTGELLEELPYEGATSEQSGKGRALTWSGEEGAFYYVDSTGLYRMLLDGAVTERLIEGDLVSFSMPSVIPSALIKNQDGSFTVFCRQREEGFRLLRYTFDATIPRLPSTQLSVYSLEDNQTIRQAMGVFQLANPDVRVDYQVGITGSDGITPADALRSLSTQILAGKGPDVLVLDGIPVESYVKRGVLADLKDVVSEKAQSGEFLPHIVNAFEEDNHIYAIPARFSVPVLLGEQEQPLETMEQLANWLEKRGDFTLGVHPAQFMEVFYSTHGKSWFLEDGTLDQQAFAVDLAQMGRIAEKLREKGLDELYVGEDMLEQALYWKGQGIGAGLGALNSLADLAGPDAAITQMEKGHVTVFPSSGVFVPRTILGVTAASGQPDEARAFVETVLRSQVLVNDFADGLPVNVQALEKNSVSPFSEDDDGSYISISFATDDEDGEGEVYKSMAIQYKWPEEENMQAYLAMIKAVSVSAPVDTVVRQILIEQTEPYFQGEKSLEETLAGLASKLELYLAE
ncbi:extracellular solute-binding protein [Oscillospiraceae bacterium MB08-C2-2]|nr:extracellular solute-binding protein [Oscillospiraceae bacterium MB08-C2-2]